MRWRSLFDDLEAQLAAERQADTRGIGVEQARLRDAAVTLADRLADLARGPGRIRVRLTDGSRLDLGEVQLGEGWLAGVDRGAVIDRGVVMDCGAVIDRGVVVDPATAGEAFARLIPFHAIAAVNAVDSRRIEPQPRRGTSVPPLRVPLEVALRDLTRRRISVEVQLPGEHLHGTIDRVGFDHLELARHRSGTNRRAAHVDAIDLIPLAQVIWLRFRW